MTRPHWRSARLTAVSVAAGLVVLAGCTTRQNGGNASDDMARYLQNARGRYAIPGSAQDPWGPYIREASARFDIPETWIRALMRQESGGSLYRNGQLITSRAGAMGLMQVMPGTYRELRARHNLGPDPFDPRDNIMAGVGYMREMYDIYGAPGFLAAYNAGPNRLDDYLANQRGLPDETRKYVASIGPSLRHAAPRVQSPAEQYAMNRLPLYIPPGPRYGYGSGPTIQMASATPAYTVPAYTAPSYTMQVPTVAAPAAPTYRPPVASFVQMPARPSYTPVPQPPALAWNEPPKPVYTPAQPSVIYAAPPRPVVQAALEPPIPAYTPAASPRPEYVQAPKRIVAARTEEAYEPVRRTRYAFVAHQARRAGPVRVALAVPPPPPPATRGGGLHLISSAVAAEAFPAHHGPGRFAVPVNFSRPERGRPHSVSGSGWKLHASGPIQAAPSCHRNSHGKTMCGPSRL